MGAEGAGNVRIEQLQNELRLAGQVSHKNVCRLHDLGDADGRHASRAGSRCWETLEVKREN